MTDGTAATTGAAAATGTTATGGRPSGGAKPTAESLGIDLSAQDWQRSGAGAGAIEVALAAPAGAGAQWVLMRVSGDAAGRVLVYDRHEWECFLDGVRGGEFDGAAG